MRLAHCPDMTMCRRIRVMHGRNHKNRPPLLSRADLAKYRERARQLQGEIGRLMSLGLQRGQPLTHDERQAILARQQELAGVKETLRRATAA